LQAKRDAIARKAGETAVECVSIMEEDVKKLETISQKVLDLQINEYSPARNEELKTLEDLKMRYMAKLTDLTGVGKDKPDQEIHIETQDIVQGLLSKIGRGQ
jgi:hypothetical protein